MLSICRERRGVSIHHTWFDRQAASGIKLRGKGIVKYTNALKIGEHFPIHTENDTTDGICSFSNMLHILNLRHKLKYYYVCKSTHPTAHSAQCTVQPIFTVLFILSHIEGKSWSLEMKMKWSLPEGQTKDTLTNNDKK